MSFAAVVWVSLLLAQAPVGDPSQAPAAVLVTTRAIAALNGVFSPRGFFNLTVRLYQLPGVDAAKYDLKKSQITLDFKPGITVTQEEIRQVMIGAGYKPGPVKLEMLAPNQVTEIGPGWVKIKHPTAKNAVVRWFQLNF
jgi:copper chaperone CopZ